MKISLIFKLVLILIFLVLAFVYFPIPSLKIDKLEPFELTESHFSMIQASHNLYRRYPDMITRSDNPTTAEKSELGRLLYFDSVLSGNNDISCAHCHHPDLGFSDNRGLSMGKGGKGLGQARNGGTIIRRGSPTIWNTAYNQKRPYLDLLDASRAIIHIIENDIFDGRIYNVLTQNSTVRQVIDIIREFVPSLEVEFVDTKIMNQLSYEVLCDRFKSKGFVFSGDLKRGIKETILLLKNANKY